MASPVLDEQGSAKTLKTNFILQEKTIEVKKKHSIEKSTFRMTLMVDLCHSRDKDSKNRP